MQMKNLFLTLISLLISVSAFAQSEQQESIINKKLRPTPELLLSKKEYLKDFGSTSFTTDNFSTEIPTLIVSLEKAFPGAKYAFLGRDMDLVADAVEAFYLSIGQTDRVARIKISTPSLQGATPDLITDYLIQLGLDVDPKSHKPPMVMVDYTSFGFNSQSTIITNAVLSELASKKYGLKKSDVLTRFNVASIAGGSGIDTEQSKDEIANELKEQNKAFAKGGSITGIVRIPVDAIAYGSEWHDKYGPLTRNANGKVTTTPSYYYANEQRAETLKPMIKVIKLAISKKFQKQVADLAMAEDVMITNLPGLKLLTAEEKIALENAKVAAQSKKFKESLQLISSNLQGLGDSYTYNTESTSQGKMKLTLNGALALHLLNESENFDLPKYLEFSLDFLAELYAGNKIGARDFRRIFIAILENHEITDPKFVEVFQANYRKHLPLEIAMGKPDVREKYMELSGLAGLNYKKLASGGALPLSCKFLLLNAAE
jgi:hypothetical protein